MVYIGVSHDNYYLSFCNFRTQTIRQGAKFIGFANYAQMFGDDKMWTALKFTVFFTLISVVLESVLGMLCALIMNRQGKMTVRNPQEPIYEIFEVTGFTDILTIERD